MTQTQIEFDTAPRRTREIIAEAKAADQDFEFYPTTDEIIRKLMRHVGSSGSVLDIGAGHGKVLAAFKEKGFDALHAIEKSSVLCRTLPEEVLIVGTDFAEQSLFSKRVDVVFCNPPYSEFEQWSEKIIRQAASRDVFLVIPKRWQSSVAIKDALEFRDAKADVLGEFDFADAEDRRARAQVHLIRVKLERPDKERRDGGDDPFERFFAEQFADLIAKFKPTEGTEQEKQAKHPRRAMKSLVIGPTYPAALVDLYNLEMAHVEKNYQLASQLDVDLLREFEISPDRIMKCLKTRLAGLRNDYWNELFNHLSTITERLTSKSRQSLLGTLQKHVAVDFTLANILEVVCWMIRNANRYIDRQLVETYEVMVDKCNAVLYKSNQRTWRDELWRYCREDEPDKPRHYALDYRIVTHRVGGISSSEYSWEKGLQERGAVFLGDLLTIANNLGFRCDACPHLFNHDGRRDWTPGTAYEIYYTDRQGEQKTLYEVRGFKNGNLHLKLAKAFILALNVEHGRLKGWLRNAREAAEELQDPAAAACFKTNLQLNPASGQLFLTGTQND